MNRLPADPEDEPGLFDSYGEWCRRHTWTRDARPADRLNLWAEWWLWAETCNRLIDLACGR